MMMMRIIKPKPPAAKSQLIDFAGDDKGYGGDRDNNGGNCDDCDDNDGNQTSS